MTLSELTRHIIPPYIERMNEALFTHPDNAAELMRLESEPQPTGFIARTPLLELFGMCGIPLYYDRNLPKRSIEEVWHPPAGDRFIEYGPEDEAWMKPLGLGRIEQVDRGPYIAKVRMPTFRALTSMNFAVKEPKMMVRNYV